jgi:hypothetical protein
MIKLNEWRGCFVVGKYICKKMDNAESELLPRELEV